MQRHHRYRLFVGALLTLASMGGYWEVLVDLWTAEEGRSDLVLHSRVIETEDSFEIELCSIHVP